uniref:F-box domain-containing protein n=1 Tax=Physcomitrium patens TaxID=3218 RepID=A0A7I4A2S6_PHYPA
MVMDALNDEMLRCVLEKLDVSYAVRALSVCKRWKETIEILINTCHFHDRTTATIHCPLIFIRDSTQHWWYGYDSTTCKWVPLPPLRVQMQVSLCPLAGNGKSLLGFKISSDMSQVVVGNPYTGKWERIPRSTDTWGEAVNVLLVDNEDSTKFRIIAIREEETEVYNSNLGGWTLLKQSPPLGSQESMFQFMTNRLCPTLCEGFLYCYCTNFLISFDVQKERWTNERIPLSKPKSTKFFVLFQCEGRLFAAIESSSSITVLVLGHKSRQFSELVVMPGNQYSFLSQKSKGGKLSQLKAVGHKHRIFFWRSKRLQIIAFDLLRKMWEYGRFCLCSTMAPSRDSLTDSRHPPTPMSSVVTSCSLVIHTVFSESSICSSKSGPDAPPFTAVGRTEFSFLFLVFSHFYTYKAS